MKYLKSFYESNHEDSVVIYDEAIKKFLPEKFRIYTSNGEFSMKKDTITREIDILRICYEHNTMEEFGGNALADGEPDTLEFDMHFVKEDNKLKILIDITYGDSMVSEFSVKQPNKLDVIHYNGIGSKADPETHFGLCDDSIKDLTKFINAFGFKFQTKDFSFIDKYPETYVAEDVKLAPLSGDQKVMVVNNAKPQENRFLHNILRYLKMRGIEYVVATNPEDVSRINSNDNIIGAILSGSDYRFTKPLDESEPLVSKKALEILKCPILGLCYGMQSMVVFHGGEVKDSGKFVQSSKKLTSYDKSFLFDGIDLENCEFSFAFHDIVTKCPDGFKVIGKVGNIITAISNDNLKRYGLLFHPEDIERTFKVLDNFVKLFHTSQRDVDMLKSGQFQYIESSESMRYIRLFESFDSPFNTMNREEIIELLSASSNFNLTDLTEMSDDELEGAWKSLEMSDWLKEIGN